LSIIHHTRKQPSTGPRTTHVPQSSLEFAVGCSPPHRRHRLRVRPSAIDRSFASQASLWCKPHRKLCLLSLDRDGSPELSVRRRSPASIPVAFAPPPCYSRCQPSDLDRAIWIDLIPESNRQVTVNPNPRPVVLQ
jgi:hypothetical protein